MNPLPDSRRRAAAAAPGRPRPRVLACLLALTVVFPFLARAFPPAPNYTIYGLVRDQVGATLKVDGAEIILLRDNAEIGRAPIFKDLRLDSNYELTLSIDQSNAGTRTYSTKAVAPQGVYSLKIVLNGQTFFPIEAAGTLRAGNGGERVRLDLTLGADANNDGLPDAWQEWVLYQSGRLPGTAGWDINLVTPNGDFDGDGISNRQEYLAGTFAGDATERFELKFKGKTATQVSFEFFAITGKVYSIEQSADLRTWTAVPLATTPTGAATAFFRANTVGVQAAYVAAPTGTSHFYRLAAR